MYITYYVDVSNSFNQQLSATAISPMYMMDGHIPIRAEHSAIIGSNLVYFPPFEYDYIDTSNVSGVQHREIGLSDGDCLNWHQFLAHMRFKKYKWVDYETTPSTVVYKLKGSRVLVNSEECYIGNSTIGYDIQMGFDTGVNLSDKAPYNFSYIMPPSYTPTYHNNIYNFPTEHGGSMPWLSDGIGLYAMLITNQGSEPYKLNFTHLKGNSVRFLTGTQLNTYFMNGMIQTYGGTKSTENSDIVFERMFVDKFSGKWKSLNDIFYGVGGENIEDYYWCESYNADAMVSNKFHGTGKRFFDTCRVVLNNMWLTSSGYIGTILNDGFRVYNSTVFSNYTLSIFANKFTKIEFVNDIVATRDNAVETIGRTPTVIAPCVSLQNCTVCWGSKNTADPTGAYISNCDNVQFNYKRGLFVSDIQDNPPDSPPPHSILTSAIGSIEKERISYLHEDFSDISITAKNCTPYGSRIMAGNYNVYGEFVHIPDYKLDWLIIANKLTSYDTVVGHMESDLGVGVVDVQSNVWWDVDDNGVVGKMMTIRDGIGALYFDTFSNKSFNWISDKSVCDSGDTVTFNIIDGDVTDFDSSYNPMVYNWDFIDSRKTTSATTISHVFDGVGVYDIGVTVSSHNGFYSVMNKKSSSLRITSIPLIDFIVVNPNGTVPKNYYAGRQYLLSATNISSKGIRSISDIEFKYGENLDGDLFHNSFTTSTDVTPLETEKYVSCIRKSVSYGTNPSEFSFGGNTYTTPIVFPHPIGWSNFAMAAHSVDGSYALVTKQYFIEIKEDVYYVDLSIEYENGDHWLNNDTGFIDTFENGEFNPGWSTSFVNSMNIFDMWGDKSAKQIVDSQSVKLFDTIISSDFDMEFLLERTSLTTVPSISIEFRDSVITLEWDYKYSYVGISQRNSNTGATIFKTLSYANNGFAHDLRCDNALKSIAFRINGTTEIISYKFNNIGLWVDTGFATTGMSDITAMTCILGSDVGIGYFMGTASSGFFIENGTTEDYPLTYTQFAKRVNYTALAYDKYLCKNYRKLLPTQNLKAIVPITITHWLTKTMIGPWVLQFENRSGDTATTSLELAMLKNGVLYNSDRTGVLKIGKTYDVYIVWNGINSLIQIPEKWKSSRYSTSNVIGSTIKMVR